MSFGVLGGGHGAENWHAKPRWSNRQGGDPPVRALTVNLERFVTPLADHSGRVISWAKEADSAPASAVQQPLATCGELLLPPFGDCEAAKLMQYSIKPPTTAGNSSSSRPPFDPAKSHKLYQALLAPFAELTNGKHLIIVPSDPGQRAIILKVRTGTNTALQHLVDGAERG